MSIYLNFCYNRADKHKSLLDKLESTVKRMFSEASVEVEIRHYDLNFEQEIEDNLSYVFGDFCLSQLEIAKENICLLPELSQLESLPENKKTRLSGLESLKESVPIFKALLEERKIKEEEDNKVEDTYCIESNNEVTIGMGEVDIYISEEKLEYLLRIKELFGAKKVKIKREGVEIEFS